MRYSTQIDNVKSLEWSFNLQEAYVFSFLYSAPSWANEIVISGKVYYFVSRNLACKEIPLFTDKPDTMYRCYKALEKKGVVEFIKIEGKDCVMITNKGKEWNKKIESESDYSENNPNKLGKISETDSENNPTYKSNKKNKSIREKIKEKELPSFVLENRKRFKAQDYELVTFAKEKDPIESMKSYLKQKRSDLNDKSVFERFVDSSRSFRSLDEYNKKRFIDNFIELHSIAKSWGNNKTTGHLDLLQHLMNSVRNYQSIEKVDQATTKKRHSMKGIV